MSHEYVMPKLAMAMNEGTISEWLVDSGQKVERGELLATVETEKVAYDLESPASGFFVITVPTGVTVPVESPIGLFFETEADLTAHRNGEGSTGGAATAREDKADKADVADTLNAGSSTSPPQSVDSFSRIKASPLARKLAVQHDLELRSISGTGPGGRIVKRDILTALEVAQDGNPSAEARSEVFNVTAPASHDAEELARVPMSGMRGAIAQRMLASMQSTAQLSLNWDSDITDLTSLRERFAARQEILGTKVSMNALIAKAIAAAVRAVPIANSCIRDQQVVIYKHVNLGFAISVPGTTRFDSGLVVGVIRSIDTMGVVEIDKAMKALVERVRTGAATAEDMSGSTITLSSTAFIGPPGLVTSPILNSPNSTLVGTSTPMRKLREIDGEFVGRTVMPMSLTFDHCAFDGELAARFSRALHESLESPELMLA